MHDIPWNPIKNNILNEFPISSFPSFSLGFPSIFPFPRHFSAFFQTIFPDFFRIFEPTPHPHHASRPLCTLGKNHPFLHAEWESDFSEHAINSPVLSRQVHMPCSFQSLHHVSVIEACLVDWGKVDVFAESSGLRLSHQGIVVWIHAHWCRLDVA